MKEQRERHPDLETLERKISILQESAAGIDELHILDQLQEDRDTLEEYLTTTEGPEGQLPPSEHP